jgi:hypothetical protein
MVASFRVNKEQSKFDTRALTAHYHVKFAVAVVFAVIIIIIALLLLLLLFSY